jgi:S1-C subfamily serine protease
MGEIGITRIEQYVADGRRWKPRKGESAMKTAFAWRLMPVSLALFLCSLIFDVAPIQAQTNRLTQDERNTIEVFRQASRGVVHINARSAIETRFEKHVGESSTGTGFVLDREGRILTAFHVIQDKNEIDVILSNGSRLSARLVGTAPRLDIALLEVDASEEELFPLPLGNSRALEVGQKVIAIGNPIGLHNTLTVGVVSALQRSVGDTAIELEDALIQTDAAINPGSSGGPLLNSAGEVVGINTAAIEMAQNVSFAIPIHFARRIIPDLIEMGHPYRPRLGFSGSVITPSIAKLFGLPLAQGFLVEEVLPNSQAADAGLRAGERVVVVSDKPYVLGGDIITAINGQPFTAPSQIAQSLLQSHPGQVLRLTVYRQGRELEIAIPLRKMQMQF